MRGQMKYGEWLRDPYYLKVSRNLTEAETAENIAVLATLPDVPLRVHEHGR